MAIMKVLLLLSLLFAAGSCDKHAELEAKFKECLEETKVTEDELKSFFAHGMMKAEATNPIKCQLKCVLEKEGIFKDGVYNGDLALEKVMEIPHLKEHKAEIEVAVKKCMNEKGTDPCDTAFRIILCIKEHKEKAVAQ